MNIRISTVNVRYADGGVAGATVHFTGRDDNEYINISGSLPLSAEEYNGNEAPARLTQVIENKIVEMMVEDTETATA